MDRGWTQGKEQSLVLYQEASFEMDLIKKIQLMKTEGRCSVRPLHILHIPNRCQSSLPRPSKAPSLRNYCLWHCTTLISYLLGCFLSRSFSTAYPWNLIIPVSLLFSLASSLSLQLSLSVYLYTHTHTHTLLLKDLIHPHNLNCQLYTENFQIFLAKP